MVVEASSRRPSLRLHGRRSEAQQVAARARTAAVFLSDGTLDREPFRGNDAQYEVIRRACLDDRSERFDSMGEFYRAWGQARRD